jgi:hypothetical protein
MAEREEPAEMRNMCKPDLFKVIKVTRLAHSMYETDQSFDGTQ